MSAGSISLAVRPESAARDEKVVAPKRPEAGLSIVVQVFNEAGSLPSLHTRIVEIARRLRERRGIASEVIYVDDGSRDSTLAAARALPADPLDVQVVSLSRN